MKVMIFSLPVSAMKKKNLQIVTLLVLSIMLILCWNLELEDCFWLINIVQLVYILASFAINKERRNFTINKREFKAISMELLLIVALFFAASITKNSEYYCWCFLCYY